MKSGSWLPTLPQVSRETLAVLAATLIAAWLISRVPAVQRFVAEFPHGENVTPELANLLALLVNVVLVPMVGVVLSRLDKIAKLEKRVRRIETHLNLKPTEETP